jgi:hypothetical protein
MAWTTNPYATLAQVKAALDLQNNKRDPWIQELIDEAGAEIDRYIGFKFQMDGTLATPATRLYDGWDEGELEIDRFVSVSKVEEFNYNLVLGSNGSWLSENPVTLDITSDLVLRPNNYSATELQVGYQLARLSGLPFMQGIQNYRVTGIFGIPIVPPAITRACVRTVVTWVKIQDTNYADNIIEQGGIRMQYHKRLPDDVIEILNQYRRRLFLAW